MSSHQVEPPDCGGRACNNCGKCCEWKWEKGGSCFSRKEGHYVPRGNGRSYCHYNIGGVYHDVVRNGYHHSLCVCEKRRKK